MQPGFVPLKTATIVDQANNDRPSFDARVSRTFGSRNYHVFCFTEAMLFVNADLPAAGGNPAAGAVVAGAVLGGAVGAMIGAAVSSSMDDAPATLRHNLSLYTDDQLVELARQRGRSIVCDYPDISSARIDPPGGMDRLFGSSKLVGYITIRDRTVGRLTLEIANPNDMRVAIRALTRRLGDRCRVNLEWNEEKHTFVAK